MLQNPRVLIEKAERKAGISGRNQNDRQRERKEGKGMKEREGENRSKRENKRTVIITIYRP